MQLTPREAWRRPYPDATHGTAAIQSYRADGLTALRAAIHGENVREGDVCTQLLINGHLVMSDSRDEYRDHITAINRATGRVLINGLGLGCYLAAILTKPDVRRVDVVEINPDVLALVAPHFYDDERVRFHRADAYEQAKRWPSGIRWDVAWHDIWPDKCTDDLKHHARLSRSYGRRVDWQGCWAHERLLWLRERGR